METYFILPAICEGYLPLTAARKGSVMWSFHLSLQLIVLATFGAVDKPLAPCLLVHFLEI